jgi:enamine deaminase RidA (YjgF/YER057c/UK114 family)
MSESKIDGRLRELQITLPAAPSPVAAYVPCIRSANLLFIAGQLPFVDGKLPQTGKVGAQLSVTEGQSAARQATLNALAVAADALGGLDGVAKVVRLGCHVASAEGFTDQHLVANGASELLWDIFGEPGRHARLALGAAELPLGAPVEIELILEVAPQRSS